MFVTAENFLPGVLRGCLGVRPEDAHALGVRPVVERVRDGHERLAEDVADEKRARSRQRRGFEVQLEPSSAAIPAGIEHLRERHAQPLDDVLVVILAQRDGVRRDVRGELRAAQRAQRAFGPEHR